MKMKMIITTILLMFITMIIVIGNGNNTIISEANIPSEDEVYLTLEDTNDIDTMREQVSICENDKTQAHNMAEIARNLGYSDNHIIIQIAQGRYRNSDALQKDLEIKIRTFEEEAARQREEEEKRVKAAQRTSEYPVATQVWGIMKSYGWNDIICASIMGNMMRECGGDTLKLNPYAGSSHYGLCQWSRTYHGGAWGKDVSGQLEYLRNTLDINIFNGCNSPEAGAEIFCWNYERPAKTDPVYKRMANARVAYNYFVN